MKAHVYEDFKTEMITREEYFIFKAEFDKNIQEAKEAIARLVGNKIKSVPVSRNSRAGLHSSENTKTFRN